MAIPPVEVKALWDGTALTSGLNESATEVQTQAIPPALEGADLMVSASTGSVNCAFSLT